MRSLLALIALGLWPLGEAAADWQGPVEIESVLSSGVLQLEDGRHIKLAGLAVGFAEVQPQYAKFLAKRSIAWQQSELGQDRHGRSIALARFVSGELVQSRLLRQGWAVRDGITQPPGLTEIWRSLERDAREAQRGIWRQATTEDSLLAEAGNVRIKPFRFAIVEGVVRDAGRGGGNHYLNFGADWQDDFTIRIRERLAKSMIKNGWRFDELEGKRLSVRGWIFQANGPMIEIVSASQIELVR